MLKQGKRQKIVTSKENISTQELQKSTENLRKVSDVASVLTVGAAVAIAAISPELMMLAVLPAVLAAATKLVSVHKNNALEKEIEKQKENLNNPSVQLRVR
jgi:hypothetical protein